MTARWTSVWPSSRVDSASFVWLVRLRWLALIAQAVTVAVTALWLPVPLQLPVLVACLAFTGVTNLALVLDRRWVRPGGDVACALLLAVDTLTLTAMLGAAGGAHNPFTSFYLLQVALAALLLPQRLTIALMALAAGGFTFLYSGMPELCGLGGSAGAIPEKLHFQGMFVALGLTSGCLAYFVGRLQADLRRAEAAYHESHLRLARQERFAGLATLAAGVAHELATPLSTVAVVSKELERTACTQCLNGACRDDARLIRTEVDRCRAIIDRLNADSTWEIGDASEVVSLAAIPADLSGCLTTLHARRLSGRAATAAHDTLRAPKTALLQALAVLIKNGCEADPSGQPVILEISSTRQSVVFSVTDHGPGFEMSTLSRLGEPFFTTKPPHEGKGLGLFIVRMFAERLGGQLEFRSGLGGCVRLTLPRPAEDTHG